jgi:hypothetical protein
VLRELSSNESDSGILVLLERLLGSAFDLGVGRD